MRYSPVSRIAYYHIHKTGGTSMKRFLHGILPDLEDLDRWSHHSLADYFDILRRRGVDPGGIRILTTIRHPFEHVVSIYHYWRARGNPTGRDHVQAAKDLSFDAFVRFYTSCRHPDCRVYDELLLLDGVLPPNLRVLRLEHLAADVDRALNDEWELGIPVAIPHTNSSEHGPAASYYDAITSRLVLDRYSWAFRQGYYSDESRKISAPSL